MALALKRGFPFIGQSDPVDWELHQSLMNFKEGYRYTPDIRTLQMNKHWYVFEYGEHMQSHRKHTFLVNDKAKFVGAAFTQFANLVMYKKDLGTFSYPIALSRTPKPKEVWLSDVGRPARIKGELYCVEGTEAIVSLDIERENGVSFKRVRMTILMPYTKTMWSARTGSFVAEEFLAEVPAWFYVGIKEYWDGILDNGYSSHLVRRFPQIPNRTAYGEYVTGDYYCYTKLETLEDAERLKGVKPF